VSGKKGDTFFISPKTGNAVSFDVGEKYSRRLFKIPLCMKENFKKDFYSDYFEALQITGFFFLKILENRKQKFIFRDQLISYIKGL
jgi:DNA repair protein RecO (recombination protein O)